MIEIDNILDVEKNLDGIEAVIFDLDDTLYSEKEYVRSGYRTIAELFGDDSIEEKMWEVFLRGGKAIDEVLDAEGISKRKNEALYAYRFQMPDIHLYTGVREMLIHLRMSGKRLGMITDGRPEGQRAKITALKLWDMFDETIITDELGGVEFRKPNPKAFEIMRERMGISYKKMVYIGDNLKKDFIAPEKLGMRTVFFQNEGGLYN